MLEIVVEPRKSNTLKQAVIESIKTGDYNSLYDDIRDCFTDAQVEEMEDLLESGDISEAIDEIVSEWNGEDRDELFESIESYFNDAGIEIQFVHDDEFETEPADAEDEEDDDSFDDDDDEDYEDEDDEDLEGEDDDEDVDEEEEDDDYGTEDDEDR
jgi:hypothetical protein